MIRHFQTEFSDETGDCLRACIATIFQVEDQLELSDFRTGVWHDNARAWVRGHTQGALDLCLTAPTYPVYDGPATHHTIAIVGSTHSPGSTHAVIVDASTGELIHDPNPWRVERRRAPRFLIAVCTPTEAAARHHAWRDPTLLRYLPALVPSPRRT